MKFSSQFKHFHSIKCTYHLENGSHFVLDSMCKGLTTGHPFHLKIYESPDQRAWWTRNSFTLNLLARAFTLMSYYVTVHISRRHYGSQTWCDVPISRHSAELMGSLCLGKLTRQPAGIEHGVCIYGRRGCTSKWIDRITGLMMNIYMYIYIYIYIERERGYPAKRALSAM